MASFMFVCDGKGVVHPLVGVLTGATPSKLDRVQPLSSSLTSTLANSDPALPLFDNPIST